MTVTTEHFYTGNNSTTSYAYTFPYYKTSDIKVTWDGALKTESTHYNVSGTNIVFTSGNVPGNNVAIHIYRETDVDTSKATFAAGSSIRATDLNNNELQLLYAAQEEQGQKIQTPELEDGAVTSAKILDGTIATIDLADGAVTATKIGTNAINATNLAPNSVGSSELADDSVDTGAIIDDAVTSDKIATGAVLADGLATNAVTTAKIYNEAVTAAKIGPSAVTSAKIDNNAIIGAKIATDAVTETKILDSSITVNKIANDAVTTDKLENSINTTIAANTAKTTNATHTGEVTGSVALTIANGAVVTDRIANDAVTATKLADSINAEIAANTAKTSNATHTGEVTGSGALTITDDAVDSDKIADDAVGSEHIQANAVTDSEIATGTLDNRYYTETELDAGQLDNRYYTETESDARYFNVSTGDTIKDGDAFPDNDTTIATTAAINDRIIDLVDDVGGFVPIANETSFPNANPDVNNGTGTLISIKALSSNLTSNGSGVATISNGTVGNSTVTITGLANSTTYLATYGMIVETTSTLNTYTFHRQVPIATQITTVAGSISNVNTVAGSISNVNTVAGDATNINTVAGSISNVNTTATNITNINNCATNIADVQNYADVYQVATSAPSTRADSSSLTAGDMWFDSSSNKVLKVHNGTTYQLVTPSQSVLNDIANVSGQLTYSEDLGSITDALTTGTGNNINTVATNIANINNFTDVYRVASSAPSSSLDSGDLWFDTTGNALKVYNGSAWIVTAASGMAELIDDTTPELGGHLDCNDKNLTEVGTVSGTNLQIDFGTLT